MRCLSGLCFVGEVRNGCVVRVNEERSGCRSIAGLCVRPSISAAFIKTIGGLSISFKSFWTLLRLACQLIETRMKGLFYHFLAKQFAVHL